MNGHYFLERIKIGPLEAVQQFAAEWRVCEIRGVAPPDDVCLRKFVHANGVDPPTMSKAGGYVLRRTSTDTEFSAEELQRILLDWNFGLRTRQ